MSRPSFDKTTGWWSIRYHAGPTAGRRKAMLLKQPGWKPGDRPPRKPPYEVDLLARKYHDIEVQARHGVDMVPSRPTRLADFMTTYRVAYAATHRPKTISILARTCAHFLSFCDGEGVSTIQAVTTPICRDYLLARLAAPAKPGTVGLERAVLSACFAQAHRDGLIPKNPWADAKLSKRPDSRADAPLHWTEDELARLIAHCRGWVKDMVVVAANSGLRITTLLHLEWRDVKFEAGHIVVRPDNPGHKTGYRYDAPMLAGARDVLRRRHAEAGPGCPYVFPSRATGKPTFSQVSYTAIRRAARRAGLPEKGRWNHILRHTFVTLCLQEGVPLAVVSRWAGHRNIAMTMRYFHACKDETSRHAEGLTFGLSGHPDEARTPPPGATGPSPGDDR